MKALSILFFVLCFVSATQFAHSQNQYYRVFFKTKGPGSFFEGTEMFEKTLNSLSKKSLERRKKFNGVSKMISIDDVPVYSVYIDSVLTTGVRLHHTLKWQNYIVVDADSLQMVTISKLPFVKKVQPTSSKAILTNTSQTTLSLIEQISNCGNYRYGSSFNQISMMNLPPLHSMGFSGTHSTIGVLDNGFIWRNHIGFKHLKRIKEYDFIYNDTITSNESNDVGGQDDHGTVVLGSIAGYMNDSLVGSAPFANYYLCKTEDNKHEKRIEEDHYAAAIEWLEAEGVDISTSSLGYFPYDGSEEIPTYSELDGKTTIVSKVVNTATKKGMICITAAGNSGNNFRTIISPGDADSVFTIGAVNPEGNPAGFTSRGPLENGKIKPDFAAQGVQVFTVSPQSTEGYTRVNGTSFATPLFAGAVGVLASAFPELPPYKIRAILKESSSQYTMPDSILGFGVPDVVKAFKKSGIAIAPPSNYPVYNKYQRVVTNIVSDAPISLKRLHVLFDGETEETIYPLVDWNKEYMVYADIPLELFKSSIAKAYITTENANFKKRYPFNDTTFFAIQPQELSITCGVSQEDLPVSVNEAYTSMVVPSVISYDNYATTKVVTMVPSQESLSISIYGILGNEVSTVQIQQPTIGLNWIPIQTSSLSSGMYLIVVKQGARTSQASYIINR